MITTENGHTDIEHLSDQEVVDAILKRDTGITYKYLYEKCYPLFKSVYNRYYTDCTTCIEFINDIYVQIMTPIARSGKSYLEGFKFRCSLTFWLKQIAENRCKFLYKRKPDVIAAIDSITTDYLVNNDELVSINLSSVNKSDVQRILSKIKPIRFRLILELIYLEGKNNEEVATALNMSRNNLNTKHFIARQKLMHILREEGLI